MRIYKNPWWGMLALIPATAMCFLDQTILPVALPAIQLEFEASLVAMQWSVNAYLIALALFVLLGGKFVDAWGGRSVFMGASALFVGSSIACGFSPSTSWLIGGRFIQGIAGALLVPSSAALMLELFPPAQRGKAMGVNVSVSSLFLILGPLIGGWLTENLSWRWVFWINLPLGALSIGFAKLFFPRVARKTLRIDFWGSFWFSIATVGFVVGLMQGPSWNWCSLPTAIAFGIGILACGLLFLREKRAAHPYLEFSLMRFRVYRAATISVAASAAVLMLGVFWAIFFQQTLGYSPTDSGILTFVSALPVLYMSPIAGAISDRIGPKVLISMGFACMAVGLAVIALFCQSSHRLLVLGLFVYGSGIPLIMTPSYSAGLSAVPASKVGIASALMGTLRTLASTFSIAAIGASLGQHTFRSFLDKILENPPALISNEQAKVIALGENVDIWSQFSPHVADQIHLFLQEAQISALIFVHIGIIVILGIVWVVTMRIFRHLPIPPHEHGIGEGWD